MAWPDFLALVYVLTVREVTPEFQQDYDSKQGLTAVVDVPLVNGTSGEHLSSDDVPVQSGLVDGSGGSDTDTSKPESLDQHKDGPNRAARSNSIKKPISFKTVSVTKNFLAKAATAAPLSRPGDKGATPGQANASLSTAAKPRLVAKSGAGNGLPRPGASKGNGGSGAGPDASKVWNKNRRESRLLEKVDLRPLIPVVAVPPPPPKQFTDEELKQQYGIHMATRLQADEGGKEAKWADIEDDEDDWAPETVEWMDGTKSSVMTAETQRAAEESKPSTPNVESAADPKKPQPQMQRGISTNTSKTILKPGTLAQANQGKSGGLFSKGASDKPSLVAKSPAPAPSKSPWAPLPPIDKVSPVAINPQPQSVQPSRFDQNNPHGFAAMPPPPSPAKEIAADDFSRSWREERSHKELFNSQSGRYEPVNETRRGSVRNDQGYRQTSVLQRPPPGQFAPAEPSPAFQTYRSEASADSSWGRQRASSSVSGGSGVQARRLSSAKHQDAMQSPNELNHKERRTSYLNSGADVASAAPTAGQRNTLSDRGMSPADAAHSQRSWSQRPSPVSGHVQPVSSPATSTSERGNQAQQSQHEATSSVLDTTTPSSHGAEVSASTVTQDPVALQKQIMREKIEFARQRKKEEEEKEDAAKKERIRLKLASLGMPSADEKIEKKETSKDATVKPQLEVPAPTEKTILPHSPPKPPIPTSSGEITQYGLIKVHQPQSLRKQHLPEFAPTEKPVAKPSDNGRLERPVKAYSPKATSAQPNIISKPDIAQKMHTESQANQPLAPKMPVGQQTQQRKQPAADADIYNTWAANTVGAQPAPIANVWGPPSKDSAALGNGTFGGSYSRTVPRHVSQPAAPPSGPSSHPTRQPSSVAHNTSSSQEPLEHVPTFTDSKLASASGDLRSQSPAMSSRLDGPSKAVGASSTVTKPRPAATSTVPAANLAPSSRRYDASAWHSLPAQLAKDDKEARERFETERQSGGRKEYQPVFKETFKQTASGDALGKRRVINTETIIHDPHASKSQEQAEVKLPTDKAARQPGEVRKQGSEIVGSQQDHASVLAGQPNAGAATTTAQSSMPIAGGRSSSRFFPRSQEVQTQTPQITISDSTPPPDSMNHPAYVGSPHRPVVNLPIPKAVVKLPPAAQSPPPKPSPAPVRAEIVRVGSQPIVANTAWQDRFNGLFNKPSAPVAPPRRTQTLAISSASRAPLDISSQQNSATVSLPNKEGQDGHTSLLSNDTSADVTSKITEEELLETREFGSLPTITLPKVRHTNADLPLGIYKLSRPLPRHLSPHDVTTVESKLFSLQELDQNVAGYILSIRLPGVSQTKMAIMARPQARSISHDNNRRRKSFRHREAQSSPQNSKPRKASSQFPESGNQPNGAPRAPNARWGGNRASSQGNIWNKRAPGVVH